MKTTTWIILIVIALVIYTGIRFAPPIIDHIKFLMYLDSETNESRDTKDEVVFRNVTKKVKDMKLPIAPENIFFEIQEIEQGGIRYRPFGKKLGDQPYLLLDRGQDSFTISGEYQRSVRLFGKFSFTLSFSPEVQAEFSPKKKKSPVQ